MEILDFRAPGDVGHTIRWGGAENPEPAIIYGSTNVTLWLYEIYLAVSTFPPPKVNDTKCMVSEPFCITIAKENRMDVRPLE